LFACLTELCYNHKRKAEETSAGERTMKKALCVCFLLAAVLGVFAMPPGFKDLESVARGFARFLDSEDSLDRLDGSPLRTEANEPLYYVAHLQPRGFIILANELAALPVVAWSEDSDFPDGELPDNFKWYLDTLAEQLNGISALRTDFRHPDWENALAGNFSRYAGTRSVSPLVQTTWNQGYPYNSACPVDASGPGGRVYAGCVATAMAQICKYWNYPASGSGSYSYSSSYGILSADFANSSFDWASMPNSISSPNAAIGDLIYKCGVSCHMTYAAAGSFATGVNALHAAIANFGYSPEANSYYKSNYPLSTWNSMLQSDLDQGRPIGYSGGTGYSAHAFLMDGYQATDYYHINWGWGGYYNGYFYLDNLSPASGYNYTANQAALLGVYPAVNKPASCLASQSGNDLNVNWTAPPVTDFYADWKAWGGSREYAGFGFAGSVSYETAIRFPVSSLGAYQNRQLQRVRFIANTANCSYALKVYTGGSNTDPGTLVRTQAIPSFIPETWNTVELGSPVTITGTQEIWISIAVTQTTDSYPVSLDYGPRVQDYGNKIKVGTNAWTTLYALNSAYDYNWTIIAGFDPVAEREADRALTGYKVWRLEQGQINQPTAWTLLTPSAISNLSLVDSGWSQLGSGTYLWAVKAIHTQGIVSNAKLSNAVVKLNAPGSLEINYTTINNRINLSWQAVSGATSYKLYRSTNPYSGFQLLTTTSNTSWWGNPLPADTRYFYKVVAVSP